LEKKKKEKDEIFQQNFGIVDDEDWAVSEPGSSGSLRQERGGLNIPPAANMRGGATGNVPNNHPASRVIPPTVTSPLPKPIGQPVPSGARRNSGLGSAQLQ
jgi:hypothetical protein